MDWRYRADVAAFECHTQRLMLRDWRDADRAPFAAMNADPTVMEFFPALLSPSQSDALIERFTSESTQRGFCPWALEEARSGAFVGFVGLHDVPHELAFAPSIEVGWRLARAFWGRGYATEAAEAALAFAFETLGVTDIVSFTSTINVRSQRVMQRLSMTRNSKDDFQHPGVPKGHALRPHVLYRLGADAWRSREAARC
jgi:RimJ/RimL family protein N-acetyltransferase